MVSLLGGLRLGVARGAGHCEQAKGEVALRGQQTLGELEPLRVDIGGRIFRLKFPSTAEYKVIYDQAGFLA